MSRNPPATTAEDKTAEYRYTMTIGGQTYQTFGVLSNFRAAAIATRATRVYKAKCVDGKEKDEAYAIKQCEVLQISEYQPRNCTSKVDMHGQKVSLNGCHLLDSQLEHELTTESTNRPTGAPRFSGSSTRNLEDQPNFFLALADAAKGQSCSCCLHIRFR